MITYTEAYLNNKKYSIISVQYKSFERKTDEHEFSKSTGFVVDTMSFIDIYKPKLY